MACNAMAIAYEFLVLAEESAEALTPMKITKLVYLAHGWHLAIEGKPLIDEAVEAWEFGPMIPSLYDVFAQHGKAAIVRALLIPEMPPGGLATAIVARIWKVYQPLTGVQLCTMCHEDGSAWHQVWTGGDVKQDRPPIPNELIAEYFTQLKRTEGEDDKGPRSRPMRV